MPDTAIIVLGVGALFLVIGIIMLGVASRKPSTDPSKSKMNMAGGVMAGLGVLMLAGGGYMKMKGAGAGNAGAGNAGANEAAVEGASIANKEVAALQQEFDAQVPSEDAIRQLTNTTATRAAQQKLSSAGTLVADRVGARKEAAAKAAEAAAQVKIQQCTAQATEEADAMSAAAAEALDRKAAELTTIITQRTALADQVAAALQEAARAAAVAQQTVASA